MKKDVIVSVKGLLISDAPDWGDTIETVSRGVYFEKEGRHYVMYEEVSEDFTETIRNLIKISPDLVSVRKTGLINTEMTFEKGTEHQSPYTTPFGSLILGVKTRDIRLEEQPGDITVNVDYDLEINYEHVTDCSVHIRVQPADGTYAINQ